MSFDIRVSLRAPNGFIISDKSFKFYDEVTAKDMADIVMMLLDKEYFDTLEEYEELVKAVTLIMEGYEYKIINKGRYSKKNNIKIEDKRGKY